MRVPGNVCRIILASLGLATLLAPFAAAQEGSQETNPLAAFTKVDNRLTVREALAPLAEVRGSLDAEVDTAWRALQLAHDDWSAHVDLRNGRIESAEGTGIPWIPGLGNRLEREDVAWALGSRPEPDLATLETIARKFVLDRAGLFGTAGKELRLNPGRSEKVADHLWLVDFDVVLKGLPVEGTRVVFRVGHGNLIQFGSQLLPAPGAAVPPVEVSKERAYATLSTYLGGIDPLVDTLVDAGSLHLLPTAADDGRSPEGFVFGKGYGLALVWQFVFRREGVLGTWRGRVDATTGEVLEFVNVDLDARARGGVAADSTAGTETLQPMPFTDLGGGVFANSAALYTYGGTPLTSTLNGQFVRISDTCGPISLTTDASGDLGFGTTAGSNCATPGFGGAGNTRSSRTSFYFVNRGKEIARGWLPGNAWLNGQLTASVNNTGTCNGFWNGSSIQLYRAVAGSCGASGEEPGFILHELGHGIDQNDGGGSDFATGEAYGDLTAAITLHNSCVGPGFRPGNCGGYGDPCTACTGLRDVDWARHASGVPHTVANYTQLRCLFGSGGPCGGQVHCESHVASEAVWDFANRDLPGPGGAAAWNTLERLWHLSRSSSTNAFTCVTGSTYSSHGCNVGSWWKTMRAVDDDDGNLANGTPHSAALFAAFNRHGIACAADPGAATSFRGCTQPPVPAVTLSPGDNQVTVSWSGSTGIYDVYRNEMGCTTAFTKIGNDVAGSSLVDNGVATGSTYYYQVAAHPGGNEACASAPSACQAITVTVPPPVANFTFVCTGLSCSFNGAGSTGSGLTYAWSFGDATPNGSGVTTTHSYPNVAGIVVYTATLTVTDSLGQQSLKSKKVSVTNDPVAPAPNYFAVAPCRVLDTRNTTILTNNVSRVVNITGSCGIPSTARAVSFNVTAFAPTGDGKITLYPGDLTASWSGAKSSLNFAPATSPRGNSAVIQLATNGTLGINPVVSGSPGQVHLVLDVQGYFSTDTTPAAGAQGPLGFQTLPICRIADTRPSSPLVAGTVRTFTAQGVCGMPMGATVASLHVGVPGPAPSGYITLSASNIATPLVSAINFQSGISNLRNGARVNLSPTTPDFAAYFGGAAGASVHTYFDVNGYFKPDAPLKYHPITPCRSVDAQTLVTGTVSTFQIQGNCGIPVGAKAALIRLVVSLPTSSGDLTVYPSNLPLSGVAASTVKFDANEPGLSMGTIVPLSTLSDDLAVSPGEMTAGGTMIMSIDVFGYFQ